MTRPYGRKPQRKSHPMLRTHELWRCLESEQLADSPTARHRGRRPRMVGLRPVPDPTTEGGGSSNPGARPRGQSARTRSADGRQTLPADPRRRRSGRRSRGGHHGVRPGEQGRSAPAARARWDRRRDDRAAALPGTIRRSADGAALGPAATDRASHHRAGRPGGHQHDHHGTRASHRSHHNGRAHEFATTTPSRVRTAGAEHANRPAGADTARGTTQGARATEHAARRPAGRRWVQHHRGGAARRLHPAHGRA